MRVRTKYDNSFSKLDIGIASGIIVVAIVLIVVFDVRQVVGRSMEPTLQDGQYMFTVSRTVYRHIDRGDIITFVSGTGKESERMVKRVIGIGGDRITVRNNRLYRNEVKIDEGYISPDTQMEDFDVTVPNECLFVMGDNRNASVDSRMESVGFVNETDVTGLVIRFRRK